MAQGVQSSRRMRHTARIVSIALVVNLTGCGYESLGSYLASGQAGASLTADMLSLWVPDPRPGPSGPECFVASERTTATLDGDRLPLLRPGGVTLTKVNSVPYGPADRDLAACTEIQFRVERRPVAGSRPSFAICEGSDCLRGSQLAY